jgi:hypothetical protein
MDIATATLSLEAEWEQVGAKGFFGNLKFGVFDDEGFNRVQSVLNSIELPDSEIFDKRFIEVTWFIPTFMRWQQDGWRLDGKDTKQLDKAISFFEGRLTTILGLP